MKEPEIVLEWKANEKADAVVRVLERRLTAVPEALAEAIRACIDIEQLNRWLDAAAMASSVEAFRKETSL